MTLYEARMIARIAGTVDNACSNCVGSLVEKLNKQFSEFKWLMCEGYKYEYFKYDGGVASIDDHDYSESYIEIEVKPV